MPVIEPKRERKNYLENPPQIQIARWAEQDREGRLSVQAGPRTLRMKGGICTSGGKGCISYALQLGLKRCLPGVGRTGIAAASASPVVITSVENHKSVDYVCRMLGIGTENCWRCEVYEDETMKVDHCIYLIEEAIKHHRPIAAVVFSGGNTAHLSIDPILQVKEYLTNSVASGILAYKPSISTRA
jgi:L-2,4-diaminobutyrate decarboxylase